MAHDPWTENQIVRATLHGADGTPVDVDPLTGAVAITGNITASAVAPSGTATVTRVPAAITATTLQAANSDRKGITVYNDSTSVMYLKLGAGASPTDYTVKLQKDSTYEAPFAWIGIVTGIWVAANGAAMVTENL
jgi:hypothetical protein